MNLRSDQIEDDPYPGRYDEIEGEDFEELEEDEHENTGEDDAA